MSASSSSSSRIPTDSLVPEGKRQGTVKHLTILCVSVMALHVQSQKEFTSYVKQAASAKKIVVVDFWATWCGPCKTVAPEFEALSREYTNAVFLKVDVDQNPDLTQDCKVKAMPTFQVYSGGSKVAELVGGDPVRLRAMVAQHYILPGFSGKGQTLGSTSGDPTSAAPTSAPFDSSNIISVDESEPSTAIQIRLKNGSRVVQRFNTSHTIADIRSYIHSSDTSLPPTFQIVDNTSFPPTLLTNNDLTIEEANLLNGSLAVR